MCFYRSVYKNYRDARPDGHDLPNQAKAWKQIC